jgi:SOS-response transcriptional repressor LexA
VGDPTRRQREVLRVIYRSVVTLGHSPTFSELGRALGVSSKNAVNDHLAALERKGLIMRRPGECRGITLTDQGLDALEYLMVQERVEKLEERVDELAGELSTLKGL